MTRILASLTCALFAVGCAGSGYQTLQDSFDPPAQASRTAPAITFPAENASAESAATGLPDLLRLADRRNPSIAAARHEVQAAAGGAWQASLYPNPALELEAEDVPADDPGLNRSTNKIGLVQPLVLGGKREAAVAAASAEVALAWHEMESVRRAVHADVALAFVDLLYWREASDLHEELLASVTETLRIAQLRYDARALLEADLLKSRLEVEQLRLGLRRIERRTAETLRKLEALVGEETPLSRVGGELPREAPLPEWSALEQSIRERHPDVFAARRAVERAERRLALAQREWFPDVGLRVAYGHNAEEDHHILEAGLEIPLPLFDRNQGRIKQAQHEAEAARRRAEAIVRDLEAELAEVHADYLVAADDLHALRAEILPAATAGWEQARAGFEAGRFGFLDLLDAQRSLVDARLLLLDSRRDLNTAWIHLGRIAGPLTLPPPTEDETRD